MKIVIVGAGFTGVQLAKRLIAERNDVVLIDNDEETVRHASNRLDCMVMQANGNSLHTLKEAGIDTADAIVAVTQSDELNMITCSLVNSVYPKIIKIARVRNYDYYFDASDNDSKQNKHNQDYLTTEASQQLYGINYMVHPDVEAAEAIVTAVEHGAVTEVMDFENSAYELIHMTIEANSKMDGACVQNVRQMTKNLFLLAFIEKDGVASLPSGSTILHADDRIGIITAKKNISEFLGLCGSQIKDFNKIALIGAGRIGTCIAEKLLRNNNKKNILKLFSGRKKISKDFVIIDTDDKLTKNAAGRFPSARVCRADVTDEGFIEEENLDKFDLIIAATHNHERNMVTSAYLKSLGVSKTVCLVSSSSYALISRNIGIDVAVPIRDAVVDSILSHLRGKSITGIHTVSEGDLEIVEIELPNGSPVEGKYVKEIAEAGSFLILQICKNGANSFVIPDGNTILNTGDKLVTIQYANDNTKVMEKFGVSV